MSKPIWGQVKDLLPNVRKVQVNSIAEQVGDDIVVTFQVLGIDGLPCNPGLPVCVQTTDGEFSIGGSAHAILTEVADQGEVLDGNTSSLVIVQPLADGSFQLTWNDDGVAADYFLQFLQCPGCAIVMASPAKVATFA